MHSAEVSEGIWIIREGDFLPAAQLRIYLSNYINLLSLPAKLPKLLC